MIGSVAKGHEDRLGKDQARHDARQSQSSELEP
jgi:hypothetical protein